MRPFELRLAQEHASLKTHVKNLSNFLEDRLRSNHLSEEDRSLLMEQRAHMQAYLAVLEKRLKKLNIPV